MSDLVGIEDVGRQRVAASVPGAAVSVNEDAGHGFEAGVDTGKISGSDSTDRSAAV